MIICNSSQKPLVLFHLVHKHGVTNALIFTKSAESTNRLVRLFEFFESAWASSTDGYHPKNLRSYSSELGAGDRKLILEQFRKQEIHMCVAAS